MNKYIILSLLTVITQFVNAQSITGTWSGELNIQGMKLPLVLHIQQKGDSLSSTMDSPAQGANGIPVDRTTFLNNQLQVALKSIGAAYGGTLAGDSIVGIFKQMGAELPLTFKRGAAEIKSPNRPQTPKPPFNYNIEDLNFTNPVDTNTLAGTLTTPKEKRQFPVAVMITGSGAQDRDETLFNHKPFWVIADHLAKNGIGVLRLDDRGVGGSSKGKPDPTSADFVTDVDAAVDFLVKRGYKNIGLIGHSEGGMIAPMVANNNKNVKFIVSLAGPGVSGGQVIEKQSYQMLIAEGAGENAARENAVAANNIVVAVQKFKGEELKDSLTGILTNYFAKMPMTEEVRKNNIDMRVKLNSSPWFVYFLNFDPQQFISKLKIPVLAINGSKDAQVDAKDNLAAWKAGLEKAGNKNFRIEEMQGLNHLFQEAKTGSLSEYNQIEQTISPGVLDLITNWILKLK